MSLSVAKDSLPAILSNDFHQHIKNLKIALEQAKIDLNSLNCIEYERTKMGVYHFSHHAGTYDDLSTTPSDNMVNT